MARSATPKNPRSIPAKRNHNRWLPEAREAQRRRRLERKKHSLLESIPEAGERLGMNPNQSYLVARAQNWPLIETGKGRYGVPKAFVERLVEEALARSLPRNENLGMASLGAASMEK